MHPANGEPLIVQLHDCCLNLSATPPHSNCWGVPIPTYLHPIIFIQHYLQPKYFHTYIQSHHTTPHAFGAAPVGDGGQPLKKLRPVLHHRVGDKPLSDDGLVLFVGYEEHSALAFP